MRIQQSFFIFLLVLIGCSARDTALVPFIKSYVENEGKPTFLVSYHVCWSKNVEISLVNELAKMGVRTSTSRVLQSKFQHHQLLFVLDLDCPYSDDVIVLASTKHLFRSPYRWLLLMTNSTDDKLTALRNSSVLADSDLVVAKRKGDLFQLDERWYNGTVVDARPHRQLFRRRRNLARQPITMSNVIQDSNTTRYHLPREDRLEPQYDSISKICWMNVRLAFEMLNATPAHIFANRWGYKVNGQWSGMIEDLRSGRAELGTNCATTDIERLDVVSYTDMLAPFRVRFIFRQPPLSYVSNIFSLPFGNNVWAAIFVCAALSTCALYLISVWELKYEKRAATQLDGRIGDAMLLTMSAVSQQGCVMEPKRAPGRIMLFVLFTALMALYAAYSANIVVLLQAPSHSITSLQQLASAKVTIAANDVDYNHFVFRMHKDPVRVMIYKRVDPEKGKKNFYDINVGVERIRRGLFAFHSIVEPVYRRIEETFLETEKCDLVEVDFMNSFDPFVPVKKDSPYLELLRVTFKRLRESGIQSALAKRLQVPKPRCSQKVAAFSSVGLSDLAPVLVLMANGAAVSVAILFVEIIYFKISRYTVANCEKAF